MSRSAPVLNLMTVEAISEETGVSQRTVRRWIEDGDLPVLKFKNSLGNPKFFVQREKFEEVRERLMRDLQ